MTDATAASTYRLPPLAWLRAFEATARHLSFTKGAAELNLTQAAVSHQVRSLERHLGFLLFERLPRSLRLTEIGAAYLPPVRRSFADLASATDGLFGPVGNRTLTLRAPTSFVALWLAPRLKRFTERFPDISIRVATVVWAQTHYEEPVDVDIRYGDGNWPGYTADCLMTSDAIAVCRPDELEQGEDGQRLERLTARRPLIHVTGYEDMWQRLAGSLGMALPQLSGVNVDTTMAALELATSGVGPAIVQQDFAAPYLERGQLVKALDTALPLKEAHYLATPDNRQRMTAEATVFTGWIRTEIDGTG